MNGAPSPASQACAEAWPRCSAARGAPEAFLEGRHRTHFEHPADDATARERQSLPRLAPSRQMLQPAEPTVCQVRELQHVEVDQAGHGMAKLTLTITTTGTGRPLSRLG